MTIKEKQEAIANLLRGIEIEEDLTDCDISSVDNIREYLEDGGFFHQEVIYYGDAMEFLAKNDVSLCESLQLASEYGYSIESLNSEILASLLKSENCRNDFYSLEQEIQAIIDEEEDEDE